MLALMVCYKLWSTRYVYLLNLTNLPNLKSRRIFVKLCIFYKLHKEHEKTFSHSLEHRPSLCLHLHHTVLAEQILSCSTCNSCIQVFTSPHRTFLSAIMYVKHQLIVHHHIMINSRSDFLLQDSHLYQLYNERQCTVDLLQLCYLISIKTKN